MGSAAIQLAKLRDTTVIAQCAREKSEEVLQIGADKIVFRDSDLVAEIGSDAVDVVIDLVGGSSWTQLLDIIKPGGPIRYLRSNCWSNSGTGFRTLYLKDLILYGCTFQPKEVFRNLIKYIEDNKIKPLVAKSYPLKEIKRAPNWIFYPKNSGKTSISSPDENV
ncbi:MAG: hypothetical protein Ct9H300mP28_12300 [Pseudomonadota bacterium]|nr:MAG: hypothetical protein Ct9H300mP28_12300 [Pseudomonadota bacterium]